MIKYYIFSLILKHRLKWLDMNNNLKIFNLNQLHFDFDLLFVFINSYSNKNIKLII